MERLESRFILPDTSLIHYEKLCSSFLPNSRMQPALNPPRSSLTRKSLLHSTSIFCQCYPACNSLTYLRTHWPPSLYPRFRKTPHLTDFLPSAPFVPFLTDSVTSLEQPVQNYNVIEGVVNYTALGHITCAIFNVHEEPCM